MNQQQKMATIFIEAISFLLHTNCVLFCSCPAFRKILYVSTHTFLVFIQRIEPCSYYLAHTSKSFIMNECSVFRHCFLLAKPRRNSLDVIWKKKICGNIFGLDCFELSSALLNGFNCTTQCISTKKSFDSWDQNWW